MQGLISKELKSPPPQSIQHSSAGIREQSNPRGTVQKSEGGLLSYLNRGRLSSMGQGTPSIAPDQAKEAVPRPPSVDTPPRSGSAERQGGISTPRTETPPRSRSAERGDGRDGGNTPTRKSAPTATTWLDAPRRPSSTDPPREPPATPEGLGSIVIGRNDEPPSGPPEEDENRSSSMGMIGRALSAISNIERAPRPTRGRSAERTQTRAPPPPSGDSDGDSSSYGSDVRTHQNPVAQEPRIPARQRPEVPVPPLFHEDIFMAGFQMGAAVQAQQSQFMAQSGGFNFGTPPPAPNQPQGEPDPELPGAGEPSSEQPTEAGSEVIEDDSDAETLRLNEGEDRSEYPDNTENDSYEDAEHPEGSEPEAENPEGSQADVRTDPDIMRIDIDESPDEAQEHAVPEQSSQSDKTPRAATEAAVEPPPESIVIKEKKSDPSKPPAFTGSIADWARLKKSSPAEPKHGKSPEKESLPTTSEHSPPQASPSEAVSSKEDKEQSSKPTQGEGEPSSASQAPPAESSAAAASEDPKSASSEQKQSEAKSLGELELRKIHRRRKPIQKPRQETEEEKAERERLEKIADDAAKQSAAELIAQEQKEKQKLSDKEAKSRQAAAANTEKAREAADKAKKKKESDKAEEKVPRSVARRMMKVPEKEDGDPPDDPTPWTIFTYRQPMEVRAGYTYDGASITNKMNVIDPQYTVKTKSTSWGRGNVVKPIKEVLFLQGRPAYAGAKHRIRDIRSVQIERTFTNTVTLFPGGHMCNTKDGKSVLMRVTTPYSPEDELLLRTLPGEAPTRYTLANALAIQHLKLEADFKDSKLIAPLAHCARHFATRAIGYKLKDGKVVDRPAWFTPGVESGQSLHQGGLQRPVYK